MKRVAIIGGGIAGLVAAYRLQGRAEVTLLEASDRLGGVAVSVQDRGFLIEGGPDSFLTTKVGAVELTRELGLEDEIIRPRSKTVYVLLRGRLCPMPEGTFLTVPTRIWPFVTSPLFSIGGKLRMLLDVALPRGPAVEDESLGNFVRRRLGRQAVERLAEPIMAGIYMAGADRLSLRATFPRFAELEREHRSLILGLRRQKTTGHLSPFVSLRRGIGSLVEALVAATKRATLRCGVAVKRIAPGYRIETDGGDVVADAVIVAVAPAAASALLRDRFGALAEKVAAIPSVGSTTVSLGFRGVELPDGTGFVVPRSENRRIVGCSWTSRKFEGRAPEGHALLRCFLDDRTPDPVETARAELREILGIDSEPVVARSFRWSGANPVYEVGHPLRVRAIEDALPAGLFLAGSGFRGIGLPDVIRDATGVAERVTAS